MPPQKRRARALAGTNDEEDEEDAPDFDALMIGDEEEGDAV